MNTLTFVTFLASVWVAVINAKYQGFTKQELFDIHDSNFHKHSTINSGYLEDSSTIPQDEGSASYGDMIYSKINETDTLLFSEILVNDNVTNKEETVSWNKMFSFNCIIHVKVLDVTELLESIFTWRT